MQVGMESLVRRALEAVRTRRPTVWDARRMLAPLFGRWIRFGVDDGQFVNVSCEGILRNVVHRPDEGFALVLDRVRPVSARARSGGRRMRVPVRLMRSLPEELMFLAEPPARWRLPEVWLSCPRCAQNFVTGKFCQDCGAVVRKGGWPGPGFAEVQRILREEPVVRECHCGGVMHADWRHCTKCGHDHA